MTPAKQAHLNALTSAGYTEAVGRPNEIGAGVFGTPPYWIHLNNAKFYTMALPSQEDLCAHVQVR